MARKGRAEEGHVNQERWLLTYADLITLLLVFFVVMYSISKADERKFAKFSASLQKAFNVSVMQGQDASTLTGDIAGINGTSLLDDFTALRSEVQRLAQEMGVRNQVNVVMQKEGIAISFSGNLLFDSGRAELRPEAVAILDKVAQRLRPIPNEIRVEGHTDNIPIDSDLYPTNWELSAARATVVTRYLTEVGQIQPERLSAQGFSNFRPIVDNDTRENRALNRRVDILIVYPDLAVPEELRK